MAEPRRIADIVDGCRLADHDMVLMGSWFKRMEVPLMVPPQLRVWYTMR